MPPNRRRNIGRLRQYEKSPEKIAADALLKTPAWTRTKALLMPRGGPPQQCHLCLCDRFLAPSDSLDHVIPRTERPDLTYVPSNIRPVHHKPCRLCGQRCNIVRGMGSVERARKILAERKAAGLGLDVRQTAAEAEFIEGRDL